MNDILDSISTLARRAAGSALNQVAAAQQEQKLRRAYQAIGKLYCTRIRSGDPLTGPEFDAQVAAAEAALDELRRVQSDRNNVTIDAEE